MLYASVLPTSGVLIHRIIPLTEVRVEDSPDTDEYKNAFLIGSTKKSFMVYSDTAEDKAAWLKTIRETADAFKRDTRSLQIDMNTPGIEAEAPIWQPDSAAKNCTFCKGEFSLLNRRHHCRLCGKLVCGNCSTHRVVLPNIDTSKQRVCDQCFEASANGKSQQDQQQQQPQEQQQPSSLQQQSK